MSNKKLSSTLDLSSNLYDKKPITWLIRELQKQIDDGKDFVELTTEKDFGDTSQILLFSE
jgi:hypothetical protein